MKKVFSGIQPSGKLHIGNYLGAIKRWVSLQETAKCIFCIVDYHAITVKYDPKEMPERILEVAATYLAVGVDPERSIIFVQSKVPEHTELAWILNTIIPVSELERMTQFKEKKEQHEKNVNMGLFDYPVLMAADILLYNTNVVPVGEDQVQHVELARKIARKFNKRFGETFILPAALVSKAKRIMSLHDPGKKMAKSLGPKSYIALSDEPDVIKEKIMGAVTDLGPEKTEMSPGIKNLFFLLEEFSGPEIVESMKSAYEKGSLKYIDLKNQLAEDIAGALEPIRTKQKELLAKKDYLAEVLNEGAKKARDEARKKIEEVKKVAGLL